MTPRESNKGGGSFRPSTPGPGATRLAGEPDFFENYSF